MTREHLYSIFLSYINIRSTGKSLSYGKNIHRLAGETRHQKNTGQFNSLMYAHAANFVRLKQTPRREVVSCFLGVSIFFGLILKMKKKNKKVVN